MKDKSLAAQVSAFLKAEAFYIAVVIFVLAMGVLQTAASFRGEDMGGPRALPIDQNVLRMIYYQSLTALQQKDPDAALFPLVVRGLNLFVLVAGSAAVLGLAFAWLIRGSTRRPPRETLLHQRWGLWDAFKLAAFFTAGTALFQVIFPTNPVSPFTSPGDWMAALFGQILLVGMIIHIVVAERGGRITDLGLRRNGVVHGVWLGLLGFLVVQPFLRFLEAVQLEWISPLPLQETLQGILTTGSPMTLVLATFVAVIAAPLTEELFFRAFLQPVLQRWMGAWCGILAGAAFFAAGHMDLYNMAPLFVLGLALGYLYHRTQSLVAPVTLHMAHNGLAMLTLFAHRSLAAASS